jgi:GMP synthase-like glutamine amidotransferase
VTASAIVLQTHDNCPPGLLGDWATSRGVALDVVRVDRWGELPDPSGYDCAIALGSYASLVGPSADWVAQEVAWIRYADAAGVPVLGISFGAQALAVALGGAVKKLRSPELAWIELDTADPDYVGAGPWLALHEDTVVPPPLAYELARNDSGPQAFMTGSHLGVQFHPEASGRLLSRWIADRRDLLARVGGELLAAERELGRAAADAALRLFDAFAVHARIALRATPDRIGMSSSGTTNQT